MKYDPKLKFKIVLIILEFLYLSYFIFNMVTYKFDFSNKLNIMNIILIFVSLLFTIITCISSSKLATGTLIISIILILTGLALDVFNKLNTKPVKKDPTVTICTKDNTTINIKHKDNEIEKITYTYIFADKDDANNTINHFDNEYKEIDNVYSEITYGNENTVTFNFIITNDNKDKLDEKYSNYSIFQEKELKGFTCE